MPTKMRISTASLISTWGGCGYAPAAPGTVGSLAALAIAWMLVHYASWRPSYFVLLVLIMLGPAIWSAGTTARESKLKDPGVVVVDEVLGQWLDRLRPGIAAGPPLG